MDIIKKELSLGWKNMAQIICKEPRTPQPPADSGCPQGCPQVGLIQRTLGPHHEWGPEKSICWFFWLGKHLGCWRTVEPSSYCSRGHPHPAHGHTQKCNSEQCPDTDLRCAGSLSGTVWCHQGSGCVDRWKSLVFGILSVEGSRCSVHEAWQPFLRSWRLKNWFLSQLTRSVRSASSTGACPLWCRCTCQGWLPLSWAPGPWGHQPASLFHRPESPLPGALCRRSPRLRCGSCHGWSWNCRSSACGAWRCLNSCPLALGPGA